MSEITYLTDVHSDVVFSRRNVPRRGMMGLAPGQGQDGYGRKITTDYMATIGKRQYRVYAICISNCASHYVTVGGQKMFLRGYDIPDEVRKG